MEFFEAVKARRSVRIFKPVAVPDAVIEKAIDAALIAPNSSNMQTWEFYRVKTEEVKAKLVKACFSQPAAATAAELVVVVCRLDTWKRNQQLMIDHLLKLGEKGKSGLAYYRKVVPVVYTLGPLGILGPLKCLAFAIMGWFRPSPRVPSSRQQLFTLLHKSTALACENLMLSIAAQGYASCPMEGFDELRVKKLLGLGRDAQICMIIGIGEGDEKGIYGPQLRFDRQLFVFKV